MRGFIGTKELECKALILCICVTAFLWGCSQGGSGSAGGDLKSSQAVSASSSFKGMIGDSSGGAISVEADSGLIVVLDIPAEAMDYSREIALSVDEDDQTGEISIAAEPSISLTGKATLSVIFPYERDGDGLIISRKDDGSPLKHGVSEGTITASIYRLGAFSVQEPDEDALYEAYVAMVDSTPDGSWQDAYETFDALIWLSDYFSRKGLSGESSDCFSEIVTKSKESVLRFLDTVETTDKGSRAFTALQKFKNLMTLCEDPDQILSTLNTLLGGDDQG